MAELPQSLGLTDFWTLESSSDKSALSLSVLLNSKSYPTSIQSTIILYSSKRFVMIHSIYYSKNRGELYPLLYYTYLLF